MTSRHRRRGVIGLGGLGSATAYWLARSGVDVIGLEQFELGHVRGASHDHSRIIRRSYHTPGYVELTAGAYDAWAAVERDGDADDHHPNRWDRPVPRRCGDRTRARTGTASTRSACRTSGSTPPRSADRWPAFERGTIVADDVMAIHSPETGHRAGRIRRRRHCSGWRSSTAPTCAPTRPVASIDPVGGEVDVVTTDAGRCGAARSSICADAWTNRLLEPLGHRVGMATTREQVSYFPTDDLDDLRPGRFPVWIWMDDPSYYGFPTFGPGEIADHLKGSEDCGGDEVDPDTRTFDPDPTMERGWATFMTDLVGDRFGPPRTTTCLYTLTADRDFVLDRLPDHPNISVGLGAAHGFKFASWFGRTLAESATGQRRAGAGAVRDRPAGAHRADRPRRLARLSAQPQRRRGSQRRAVRASRRDRSSVTDNGGPSSTASPTAPSTAEVHG